MWRSILVRVRGLFRRPDLERELDEELRYHLDHEAARNRARGMPADAAALAARRAFGNAAVLKEAVRDTWGWGWLSELRQDAGYALRGFVRTPIFSLTVVGTIALGLGLNSSLFTIFNAYVLRPLPVHDPAALYEPTLVGRSGAVMRYTWPQYVDLRDHQASFTETFAYRFALGRMGGQSVATMLVTGNYFHMLGVEPALGRVLVPEDATPGTDPVVVLSHQAWRSRFGGDSGVIGRRVTINGSTLEVIGVARAGFEGQGVPIDCWIPITLIGAFHDGPDVFGPGAPAAVYAIGRLHPGVDPERARAALAGWARAISADRADTARAVGVLLESRAAMIPLNREVIAAAVPIAVAFALVMLIACANVANMMLARGLTRQREIGVRLSLGAARGRLIRQLLTESVLLAVPAAVGGFLLSRLILALGARMFFASLPPDFATLVRLVPLPPDFRVVGFMFGGAIAAAVLFGLFPALHATRPDVVQATRGNFDTPRHTAGLRNALVAGQVSVCALLLILAGVLLRGARQMEHLDAGVRSSDGIEITVQPRFRDRVLERLREEPDVDLIAAGRSMPFGGIFTQAPFAAAAGRPVNAGFNLVTPSYFRVLDIPVLHGRPFTEAEAQAGAPVAIVSEGAARALWPDRDPLGQTIQVAPAAAAFGRGPLAPFRSATVIGVSRNAAAGWLGLSRTWPVVYFPAPVDAAGATLLLRVRGNVERVRRALDDDLAALDSGAVQQIHREEVLRAVQVYPFRAAYWVSSILGAVALLLTLSGVYGVLAYVFEQRTKEIGIRMALGATTRGVVLLVLRQTARLTLLGVGTGVVLSLGISKVLNTYLYMVNTFDPLGYLGGGTLVLLTCLAAAVVPSRRAATVHPVAALRHD
jgi:putative ABC transport system permease protein